jgi:hypothetical protein
MAVEYLKRASRTAEDTTAEARPIVETMLADIAARGEQSVRDYAARLDRWEGEILVSAEEADRRAAEVPAALRQDIDYAVDRVRRFAEAQRDSVRDFEVELSPGVVAGQKLVPMGVAGCYVPAGRYAHIASAYMGVATAKAAGVPTVIACSGPRGPAGIHPAVLYALRRAGADAILTLGGVQAIAAREPSNAVPAPSAKPRTSHSGSSATGAGGPAVLVVPVSPAATACNSAQYQSRTSLACPSAIRLRSCVSRSWTCCVPEACSASKYDVPSSACVSVTRNPPAKPSPDIRLG